MDNEVEPVAADDTLMIVNRSKKYWVNKQSICSSIPYLGKMFSSGILEPNDKKVVLDFDERAFDMIIRHANLDGVIIEMDCVIKLYNLADHLMIENELLEDCSSYFYSNFSLENLEVVIPQVSKESKLFNVAALETFICRHFLKISNSAAFLDYSVDTIEYICKLNLVISSEYQVIQAITKWIGANDTRKIHLIRLLKCVRWCFYNYDLLSFSQDELMKSADLTSLVCTPDKCNCNCVYNRSNRKCFVVIYELDSSNVNIKILNNKFIMLFSDNFELNESMSLNILHDEHVCDVFFDSGSKGIRFDWNSKKYRWHDFSIYSKCYYTQLQKCISKNVEEKWSHLRTDANTKQNLSPLPYCHEMAILENKENLMLIGKIKKGRFIYTVPLPTKLSKYALKEDKARSFIATVLSNVIYIMNRNFEFIEFNLDDGSFKKSKPFDGDKFNFDDLALTSHQSRDSKVILVDKSTRDIFTFDVSSGKWWSIGRINRRSSKNDEKSTKLLAFTSALLSIDHIKPRSKRKLISLDQ
ncbi:uncharacterized protein LOC107361378 [Tetranychus urticae]|uniref:uncharacterized protein LOC107361378 n=1 Tax=Tetranychus urticae TaxID=32264 RepID=UPI00077BA593|nr:uncharacterized protein LOC107361378 [Tetranychus urticae]